MGLIVQASRRIELYLSTQLFFCLVVTWTLFLSSVGNTEVPRTAAAAGTGRRCVMLTLTQYAYLAARTPLLEACESRCGLWDTRVQITQSCIG